MTESPVTVIACWVLIVLPSALAVWVLLRAVRRHVRPGHAVCLRCSYDLTGAPGPHCPECGSRFNSRLNLVRNRSFVEQVAIGAVLASLGLYGIAIKDRVLRIEEPWGTVLVPSTVYLFALPFIAKDAQDRLEERFFEGVAPGVQPSWAWQRRWFIRHLTSFAQSGDPQRAQSAVYALAKSARFHRAAIDALCDLAGGGPSDVRRLALSQLFQVYRDLPRQADRERIATAFLDLLKREEDLYILLLTLDLVRQMGSGVIRASFAQLIELTIHAEPSVRVLAIDAIAALGPEQFGLLSDEHLCRFLDDLGRASYVQDGATHYFGSHALTPDPYLIEIIRRGGASLERCLDQRFVKRFEYEYERPPGVWGNFGLYRLNQDLGQLEVLTALRRMQNRPDPLRVHVERDHNDDGLTVRLVNEDPDDRSFPIQFGGDNRGPRMERFHIEVRDAQGRLLAAQFPTSNFGGMSSDLILAHGESLAYTLRISDYAKLPSEPGVYTLRLHYHNVLQIAAEPDVSGYVTSRSEPFTITVE